MKLKLFIIFVFVLGFILRFWQLGSNPPSLDWDEASLGYNAYSILKTGKDEYGTFLPLSFRSFGDYKPPLYVYLTTIPVALFGLTEFSTRFISALLGSLTVIVGYFLIKELFPRKGALFYVLFAFFFAVSPWHIQFSRIAFEANSAIFFSLCGIWLFFKGLKKEFYLPLAFFAFVLSTYTYHSPRVVVPFLIIGLAVLFRKEIRDKWRGFVIGLAIFVVLFIPIIQQLRSTAARFSSVTILNPQEQLGASIQEMELDKKRGDLLGMLMENRRIVYSREVLAGYLDHFNFDFLFLTGDPPGRHHAAGMGMLYFWDLPFILIGMYLLLKEKNNYAYFIFWWFLVAPVASSLASGTPHAVRSLMYLPLYQIFITVGLFGLAGFMRRKFKALNKFSISLIFILFLINFFYYIHMYYIHTPKEYSQWWQYGYKEVVQEVSKYEKQFSKVIVTYRYDQPYIYFLFYNQIDPTWYQNNWGGGEVQRANRSFGKYEFRNIDWAKDSALPNTLFVGTPDEIPASASRILSTIYFLDGSVAFRIVAR